jgi:hypothetical protein
MEVCDRSNLSALLDPLQERSRCFELGDAWITESQVPVDSDTRAGLQCGSGRRSEIVRQESSVGLTPTQVVRGVSPIGMSSRS